MARRQLAYPRAGPHRDQVGHVDAADDQHAEHAAPEQIQRRTRFLEQLVLERSSDGMETGIDEDRLQVRKALQIRGIDGVDLTLRLFEGPSRLQTGELLPIVAMPPAIRPVLRCEGHRRPQLHVGIDEAERSGKDTDNGVEHAVDPEIAADGIVAAAIESLPQRLAQDDLLVGTDFRLLLGEQLPAKGLSPQETEERRRHRHAGHALDAAAVLPADGDARCAVHRQAFEGVHAREPIVVVRHAIRGLQRARARIRIEYRGQPVGLRERERLEQDRMHDRKDGRVGRHTQRQRRHRGEGEAAIAPEQAQREPHIVQ
jgi:hypothetical protein